MTDIDSSAELLDSWLY